MGQFSIQIMKAKVSNTVILYDLLQAFFWYLIAVLQKTENETDQFNCRLSWISGQSLTS